MAMKWIFLVVSLVAHGLFYLPDSVLAQIKEHVSWSNVPVTFFKDMMFARFEFGAAWSVLGCKRSFEIVRRHSRRVVVHFPLFLEVALRQEDETISITVYNVMLPAEISESLENTALECVFKISETCRNL